MNLRAPRTEYGSWDTVKSRQQLGVAIDRPSMIEKPWILPWKLILVLSKGAMAVFARAPARAPAHRETGTDGATSEAAIPREVTKTAGGFADVTSALTSGSPCKEI